MMHRALDRRDYATMNRAELIRRLDACRDRMDRAVTLAEYLADSFTEQELCAALNGIELWRDITTDAEWH